MNKEITIGGRKFFYRVHGTGKPVIFIHGFGEDGNVWNNQVEFLKNNFQLIVPDLPGSGQSEMIEDMSMEGMAKLIKAIPDHEAITNCTMISHSMGGYIMLAFAEKYHHYLNGWVLFHSTAYADTEEKKEARRKGIQVIKKQGAFEFLKPATYNLFSQPSKDKMPELIDEFIDSLRNFQGQALVSYYEAMMQRPDRTALLKDLKIPMLFIAGKYDNAIPLNDILKQCHLPEISYFHILAESGHMGMIEEAEKSNKILNEYLINLS